MPLNLTDTKNFKRITHVQTKKYETRSVDTWWVSLTGLLGLIKFKYLIGFLIKINELKKWPNLLFKWFLFLHKKNILNRSPNMKVLRSRWWKDCDFSIFHLLLSWGQTALTRREKCSDQRKFFQLLLLFKNLDLKNGLCCYSIYNCKSEFLWNIHSTCIFFLKPVKRLKMTKVQYKD